MQGRLQQEGRREHEEVSLLTLVECALAWKALDWRGRAEKALQPVMTKRQWSDYYLRAHKVPWEFVLAFEERSLWA